MTAAMRFWVRHFFLWRVPDYVAIIIVAIVAAVVGAKVRPHCRAVNWADPSIAHPYATKETFPVYSVAIAAVLVALFYFAGELLTRWRRPAGKLNMCLHLNGWVLVHCWSVLLAFAFVDLSKLYAGRLRPDYLARLAQLNITEASWATMSTAAQCGTAREGRLSFPSGHSGTSFAAFVPPTMYLMGLARTLAGGRQWLATVALLLLILPIAVAISRTNDYRHNFDDILAGAVCGAACGVFAVLYSFRPSTCGDWTLREHPADTLERRAELRQLLGDGEVCVAVSEAQPGRGGAAGFADGGKYYPAVSVPGVEAVVAETTSTSLGEHGDVRRTGAPSPRLHDKGRHASPDASSLGTEQAAGATSREAGGGSVGQRRKQHGSPREGRTATDDRSLVLPVSPDNYEFECKSEQVRLSGS